MARNGDKTMHSFEHLISNKALHLLEPVDIREHKSCCAPVNGWGQIVLSKERLVEIRRDCKGVSVIKQPLLTIVVMFALIFKIAPANAELFIGGERFICV